jgi:hypothetical protein
MALANATPLSYWLDAFFALLEVSVAQLADLDGLAERCGLAKKDIASTPKLDMEALNQRRSVWRRVRNRFGSFGEECFPEDLGFQGLASAPEGMAVTSNTVKIYRFSDPTSPVVFTDHDEITVVCRFFQFYRSTCHTVNPKKFVREALAKAGITKDNYLTHPLSPAALISNPFREE